MRETVRGGGLVGWREDDRPQTVRRVKLDESCKVDSPAEWACMPSASPDGGPYTLNVCVHPPTEKPRKGNRV